MTIFAVTPIDPTTSSVLSLIGSLGSSGGAVIVVWMFLMAWKTNADKQDARYQEMIRSQDARYQEVIKSIESRCERQDGRYESLVHDLKDVIRENSVALQQFMRGGPPK